MSRVSPTDGAMPSIATGVLFAMPPASGPVLHQAIDVSDVNRRAPLQSRGALPLPSKLSNGFTAEHVRNAVEASPTAVATKSLPAWQNVFCRQGLKLSDPIGSGNYEYTDLPRFWGAFIQGNKKVWFQVVKDVVCGDAMLRDVVVHITRDVKFFGTRHYEVPAHLMYKVAEVAGDEGQSSLKIQEMQVSWSLRSAMGYVMLHPTLWPMMLPSFGDILGNLSFFGTCRYLWGMISGIQGRGIGQSKKLIQRINEQNADRIGRRFIDQEPRLFCPLIQADRRISSQELLQSVKSITLREKSTADYAERGDRPARRWSNINSAGQFTTFGYTMTMKDGRVVDGVARCLFDPNRKRMLSADFIS